MKFEDIFLGQKAEIKHLITNSDIEKFVDLSGDNNRLHTDEKYAASTSYKKPVAHGMLGASFISTIIGTKLPGDGALWFSQSLEFIAPVRVGDGLKIIAEVTALNSRDRVITLSTLIFNQHNQLVTRGIAKVKVVEIIEEKKNEDVEVCNNKVALVVGGTGGIGYQTCLSLAKSGFNIAFTYYKNDSIAKRLSEEIKNFGVTSAAYKCDVGSMHDIECVADNVLNRFGCITSFINASTNKIINNPLLNTSWDDFELGFDFNVKSNIFFLKKIIPTMVNNSYGKVVFISSMSLDQPVVGWTPYTTAKGALHGLMKSLAMEFGPKGIRFNCVSPSMVDTGLVGEISERTKLTIAAKNPLRRLALDTDVSSAIEFLVSEKSDYLNGETIRVNGGQFCV